MSVSPQRGKENRPFVGVIVLVNGAEYCIPLTSPKYNLDVIISVGYCVKSRRGVEFRRWAHSVLKKYIIDGYAVNEKRLKALEKTVDIQTRMFTDALNVEERDILRAVNEYAEALTLLDQYDHQCLSKPKGCKIV